jgi:hypothetical protein
MSIAVSHLSHFYQLMLTHLFQGCRIILNMQHLAEYQSRVLSDIDHTFELTTSIQPCYDDESIWIINDPLADPMFLRPPQQPIDDGMSSGNESSTLGENSRRSLMYSSLEVTKA